MITLSAPFHLLDETRDFVVVDKAPGIGMHYEDDTAGLVGLVSADLGCRVFPVHRLDKATSGVLVLAKNADCNRELSKQFEQRRVDKYYIALADRKPKRKQGSIIGDMSRSRNGCWRLTRGSDNPAVTRFFSVRLDNGLRAFILKPATGKTHQLRVAMKSLGAPIIGDQRYGGSAAERMYLHALKLEFSFQQQVYRYQHWPQTGQAFGIENFSVGASKLQTPEQFPWPGSGDRSPATHA